MKKIGNQGFMLFVFSILFSFSSILFCSDKNIRLYIQDMEQNPIRQAERGVPFLLQVVVDNMNGVLAPENVPGFEQFQVTRYGSSQSTNIINGQRTDRMIFNYSLRADATGTFRLGPLSLKDKNGAMITSQSIQVVVGDQTIAHSIKKQPYFLDTQIDKKSLYVGQELILKIKFYYAAEFENLKIVQPKFEHFVVGQTTSEPVTGIETIRGADYHYQEWQLQVYPEKIGLLTIPPVQAVYHVASDFSHGFMGMFDMFGMTSEKTVQSHARSVDVMPLPESKMYKNITAIGQFDSATLVLKQNKGEIGEGIVATCTVSGDGNFTMMKHPPLKLPEGLKYYESNSSVQKLAADRYVPAIALSAKIESELTAIENEDERAFFLENLGLKQSGLSTVIQHGYSILNLETYFTVGPKEVHAWTVTKGMLAPQAAGVIHTDFEKGFIRAEVISYEDYIRYKGEQGAKEHGKLHVEGKDYVVKDGDVMHFRFNV